MSFESLNLHPNLLKAIAASGYTQPTPIQAATIPVTLAQHDLIATAQTGTGKTAAFVLPTLQRLIENKPGKGRGPRVLILTPTRELALQVKDAVAKYAANLGRLNIATILGGMSYHTQNRQLAKPVDVLVATPGRLIDHMEQGNIDFSRLEILILDEADRMLDMGFFEDVEHIVASTPDNRQTLMFSATFDKQVARLAQKLLTDPERIDIAAQTVQHKQIEQQLHYVNNQANKKQLLLQLMDDANVYQAIVFTATKRGAEELAEDMEEQGYSVASLHGDMRQRVRNRTLDLLRRGKIQYLVATDVAARGIDVASISHVFNYDLPRIAEDYVHRIGRTGRAGAFGTAISLATLKEKGTIKRIERYIGHRIAVQNGSSAKSFPKDRRPNQFTREKLNSSHFEQKQAKYTHTEGKAGYSAKDKQPKRFAREVAFENKKPGRSGKKKFLDKQRPHSQTDGKTAYIFAEFPARETKARKSERNKESRFIETALESRPPRKPKRENNFSRGTDYEPRALGIYSKRKPQSSAKKGHLTRQRSQQW